MSSPTSGLEHDTKDVVPIALLHRAKLTIRASMKETRHYNFMPRFDVEFKSIPMDIRLSTYIALLRNYIVQLPRPTSSSTPSDVDFALLQTAPMNSRTFGTFC